MYTKIKRTSSVSREEFNVMMKSTPNIMCVLKKEHVFKKNIFPCYSIKDIPIKGQH